MEHHNEESVADDYEEWKEKILKAAALAIKTAQ